jgi:light-harvesting complex 1 alpha chain
MWRIWLIFEPRRAIIGLAVFLMALALFIHFILLSTSRFNWIEGPQVSTGFQPASMLVEPDVRTERPTFRV